MGKVIQLNAFRALQALQETQDQNEEEICLDNLVEEWTDSLIFKLKEIENEMGREAAYHFYSRFCGQNLDMTRLIVDIYLDESLDDISL